jgi:hypothetical protein
MDRNLGERREHLDHGLGTRDGLSVRGTCTVGTLPATSATWRIREMARANPDASTSS